MSVEEWRFETEAVNVISKLLTDLISRNDQLMLVPAQVTPFHSSRPPAITVKSYLEDRILKYAGCSEETCILALIYMDQVVQYNPDFIISSLNVHRLLVQSPPPSSCHGGLARLPTTRSSIPM